jgi:hypothetical protein
MGNTKLISTGKTIAIAILLLGIVHDVATFTPLIQSGLETLDVANLNAIIYMSLICGSSLVLSGLLLIMFFKKVQEFPFLKSQILIIGVFLAINGILSVIYMFDNPFAWISLLLNLSIFLVAVRLKQLNN